MKSPLAQGIEVIKSCVKTFPDRPGVYRMIAEDGELLYVGKAKSLPKRVISYTRLEGLPNRLKRMVSETRKMEIITTGSELEAFLLEINLIKELKPKYNIRLVDDKSFPYILITKSDEFPRIAPYRGQKKPENLYFGPYVSKGAVDSAIIDLTKAFLLRTCNDSVFHNRNRPCLQYHIKRCSAPCVKYISDDDYRQSVKNAVDFLNGKSEILQKELTDKMQAASESLDYERASVFRNRLRALQHLLSRQLVNLNGVDEADVIALVQASGTTCIQLFIIRQGRVLGNVPFFPKCEEGETAGAILNAFISQFYATKFIPKTIYVSDDVDGEDLLIDVLKIYKEKNVVLSVPRRGQMKKVMDQALENARQSLERKRAQTTTQKQYLKELSTILDLPQVPHRIEIFDNSHMSGRDAVGVMVVATPDGFDKKSYRTFSIKTEMAQGDDYAMMREVLSRRLKRMDEGTMPGLLMIDGGKGQLGVAVDVLKDLNLFDKIPVVAVAKGEDRDAGLEKLYIPYKAEALELPTTHPVQHFIQRLRDEAHRFAIGFHRKKRGKTQVGSSLDGIPGIGPTRKKALTLYFGSARAVAGASLEDLMQVPGISKSVAETIYYYYHDS